MRMGYVNLHFTYLLTYLLNNLTSIIMNQCNKITLYARYSVSLWGGNYL